MREVMWMAEARSKDNWQLTSSLMALLANINRDAKKHRPFKPSDFNPHDLKPKGVIKGRDIRILKDIFIRQQAAAPVSRE